MEENIGEISPIQNTIAEKQGVEREAVVETAGFVASLSNACMSQLRETWMGVVLYYEDLKTHKDKLLLEVNKIRFYTQGALDTALLASVIMSAVPGDVKAQEQSVYDSGNKVVLSSPAQPLSFHSWESTAYKSDDVPVSHIVQEPRGVMAGNEYAIEQEEREFHSRQGRIQINSTSTSREDTQSTTQSSMQPEAVPARTSKLDLLKTDENFVKYGPYALSGPSLVADEVVVAVVAEYRDHDAESADIAHWVLQYGKQYQLNTESVMTAFMMQEGSFGRYTGNLSGDYNIGNIRSVKTGKFLNFKSYQEGIEAVFGQVYRYDKVWPTEKGIDDIHDMEQAMRVYAPPHENPTEERILVAKAFVDGVREISAQFEGGVITKDQLVEEIHRLRVELQKQYGDEWV